MTAQPAPTSTRELSPAEKWVVEKAQKGEAADLKEHFANEDERKVGGTFLEELVTNVLPAFQQHRSGIRISGATIDEPLNLWNAQVSCELSLVDCQFNNRIDFRGTTFNAPARFTKSIFKGKVDFTGAVAKGTVFFDDTVFEEAVIFTRSTWVGLSFDRAKFTDKTHAASFNYLTAQILSLGKATFEGPLDFSKLEVNGQLNANGAQFNHPGVVSFERLKIGDAGFFSEIRSAGPVSFTDAIFVDFIMMDNPADQRTIPAVDLSRALIRRRLLIARAKMKRLRALSLRVEGPAEFFNVAVEEHADLRFAQFATIDVSGSTWPKDSAAFHLQGITFQHARAAANDSDSHRALLDLATRSAYAGRCLFQVG